ncbi:hypothetical protein [Streptomyces sp. NPDC046197]|uniref:hypothetical protein n=1 Tax=Streptomyces sp. NPDC046197 TaxID=3154337 RepID=UPI0033D5174D
MPGTQLTVTIEGGAVADAGAVVDALAGAFGPPDDRPRDENATVRTATFSGEAARGAASGSRPGGGRLSAPVTVTFQGTPEAVQTATDTLAHAFTAHEEGAAAGDQEQERQLRLEP